MSRGPRRRLVLALAVLLASGRAGARPSCPPGAFVVHQGARLVAGATGSRDVVLVAGDAAPESVSLVGACPPARARRHGARLAVVWAKRACGEPRRVRLKATFDAGCQRLAGVVRAPGGPPVHFVAPRCADDGLVDVEAGEECAAPGTCGGGRACVDCRCVPLVSFARDVEPVFRNCLGTACHEGVLPPGGFSLVPGLAYGALRGHLARRGTCAGEPTILAGSPDASVLFARVSGVACGTRMPAGSMALPAAQVDAIRWWIAEGAGAD